MALRFVEFYLDIPIVTRIYTTACTLTTLAVHLELVSPLHLYYNPSNIIKKFQLWRLVTPFLFYGTIGMNFFFNMVFTFRYCRMLEESSFLGRSSDFVMMFIFGGLLMAFLGIFVHLLFLGQAFNLMMVYVWSRRNPMVRMNFLGVLNFQAPYLPYVLLLCSMILGNNVYVDIIGMGVGHIYYFLEDVFPLQRHGYKILKTPNILKRWFDEHVEQTEYVENPPEDRPGGFNWGGAENIPPPPPRHPQQQQAGNPADSGSANAGTAAAAATAGAGVGGGDAAATAAPPSRPDQTLRQRNPQELGAQN